MAIRDFSPESIRDWILKEPEVPRFLDSEEVDHVADLLGKIAGWYEGDIPPYEMGDFLPEVLKDSLSGAWERADDTNRKALGLYVKFLFNNIPSDWKVKARKDFF